MIVTISCLTLAHKVSVTHALDIHEQQMAETFTRFLLGRIYVCKHLQEMITVISSRGTNFIKVRVSNGCVFLIRCYF